MKIDEREILRRAEALSQLTPSESSTQRAMERARTRLLGETRARPRRNWWVHKIVMPAGIAAALLIAVGVAWIGLTPHPVSAAEFLQQVAEINSAYKGWFAIRTEPSPSATQPAGTDSYSVWHMNTIDGTFVVASGSEGKTSIRMDVPARGEIIEYDSTHNEIRLGDMHPLNVKAIKKMVGLTPIDLASELSSFKQRTGGDPLRVERRQEGNSERIDITYFDDPEKAKPILERNSSLQCVPVTATLWVDPETRLIHRMTTRYMGRYQDGMRLTDPVTRSITYGGPEFSDIYAAGAPRDTKVIDRRLKGEAKSIMDRLDRRSAEGLGDGLAVLTETTLEKGQAAKGGYLRLLGYQGEARFFYDFGTAEKPQRAPMGVPIIENFESWPTPDVNEVLARLSPFQTSMFFVTDGWQAWGGTIANPYKKPGPIVDDGLRNWWDYTSPAALYSTIWPNRQSLFLYDVGVQVEVLHDPQHPSRVGIQIHKSSGSNAQQYVYEEYIHWIDTTRDDVPVETLVRRFANDGRQLESETRCRFLSYSLWPDGRWYPTRWRLTQTSFENGQPTGSRESECHLQFYPNLKIDPQWFADPTPWMDQARQAAKDASDHW